MSENREETSKNVQEEKKELSQAEIKRMQKEAAMDLADYKRRLKEAVELKRLQVEELELNIKYYNYGKQLNTINLTIENEKKIKDENSAKKSTSSNLIL